MSPILASSMYDFVYILDIIMSLIPLICVQCNVSMFSILVLNGCVPSMHWVVRSEAKGRKAGP